MSTTARNVCSKPDPPPEYEDVVKSSLKVLENVHVPSFANVAALKPAVQPISHASAIPPRHT